MTDALTTFARQINALGGLSGYERQASLDHWHAIIEGGDCADVETLRSICMLYGFLIGQGLAPSEDEQVKAKHRQILAGGAQ